MNLKNIKLPLKKMYYRMFTVFIVIPLFAVLLLSLFVLNQRFKEQAVEQIKTTQQGVANELVLDVEAMSLRLSHLVHTNNSEMLDYAALMDTEDTSLRYEYFQKLQQSGNLAFEPASNLVSLSFYLKSGYQTYIESEITIEGISETDWYKQALQTKNQVILGTYFIKENGEGFVGSRKGTLLLNFAFAPDRTTDRSEKLEMLVLYYDTDAVDKLKEYNKLYLSGENNLGVMQLVDAEGNLLFSSDGECQEERPGYTCIITPVEVGTDTWYLESFIKTTVLTAEFRQIGMLVLLVALLVLAFAGYFSRYLLKSIVTPIEEISDGLKQVEEGNLQVHIEAQGQSELRNMIHQFNAMVRRLGVLIGEYEEKMRQAKEKPEDFLAAMMKQEMTPQEVREQTNHFFAEEYVLLQFRLEKAMVGERGITAEQMNELLNCCGRNPRFAARCVAYTENNFVLWAFYRISEKEYQDTVVRMLREIQQDLHKSAELHMDVCISKKAEKPEDFYLCVKEIEEYSDFRHLYGENAIIDFEKEQDLLEKVSAELPEFEAFAKALYIADEKNVSAGKEQLFDSFMGREIDSIKISVLSLILAIGKEFSKDHEEFAEVFGQQSNYTEKIGRISDARSIKLWVTNYLAWILDYSAAKLKVTETDVIVKAKRYIAEHCEDAELSLTEVADYVGLNEKYFTNRFTKETGETFSSYVTALRMQKAKELLKTTSFKVYEISEMVGYRNVEHFNRVFKKVNGITPAQYRKTM